MFSFNINEFPQEVLIQIFSNLSAKELEKIRAVCSFWDKLSNENRLWAFLLYKDFNVVYEPGQANAKTVYKQNKQMKEALKMKDNLIEIQAYFYGNKDINIFNRIQEFNKNTNVNSIITDQMDLYESLKDKLPAQMDPITYEIIFDSLKQVLNCAVTNPCFAKILINEFHVSNRAILDLLIRTHANEFSELDVTTESFYGSHINNIGYANGLISLPNKTALKSITLPTFLLTNSRSWELQLYVNVLKYYPNLTTIIFKSDDINENEILPSKLNYLTKEFSNSPNIEIILQNKDEKKIILSNKSESKTNSSSESETQNKTIQDTKRQKLN